jgi:shikimate dehydrogenase
VNTVSRTPTAAGWELEGDSTDGPGFIDALRGDDGFDPAGRQCLVLGAGGAARAVTLALAEAGAAAVEVLARRSDLAERCAELAGQVGTVASPAEAGAVDRAVARAELIVNATPVGMAPGDGLPFNIDPEQLGAGKFVADLIYAPATTPLLGAARQRGAATANGLGMLIHQAARQIAIWTGRPAPIEAMSAAAVSALGHRARSE